MSWPFPQPQTHTGIYVTLQALQPEQDVQALYRVSHGSPEAERVWDYLQSGPFPAPEHMLQYLNSIAAPIDSLAFSVKSNALGALIGQIVIMNIVPGHGRAELGSIWYAPEVQRTRVNTECNYPVSYTHLDVYKRQVLNCVLLVLPCRPIPMRSVPCILHCYALKPRPLLLWLRSTMHWLSLIHI